MTPVRWHHSLVVQVAFLCAVLVACLFGAVYILTSQYYLQIEDEVDNRAKNAAEQVRVFLESQTELAESVDIESIPLQFEGEPLEIEFRDDPGAGDSIRPAIGPEGYSFIATQEILLDDGQIAVVQIQFDIDPGVEVLRAFKNQYLLMLSLVFLLTLAVLIYLIAQSLRPLQKLSEACADISSGNMHDVPLDGSSSEIRVLGDTFNRMVESLREKEKVEANLRQAQRLSAIGNLAAGVAHDVRNPLNAIKLLSSQAIDTLAEDDPDGESSKHIKTIRNEVDRLEDIVSGFLSLAKEESLSRAKARLIPLLEECAALVAPEAEKRRVNFHSEIAAGNCTVDVDSKQMSRALLNILLNALDACPESGRVRMLARVDGAHCEIEVRDDGDGIPEEIRDQIFDPYFTTKSTGTGLGLSITRGIIEEHGGTITVFSTPGSGTQVIVRLPKE